MKYTNYFSAVIQSQGVPHLDTESFKSFMNLVFLEGKISGMDHCEKLKQAEPGHIEFEKIKFLK